MERRAFLAGLGTATGVGLVGSVGTPGRRRSPQAWRRTTVRGADRSLSDRELPVPESELIRAAPRDNIPAITDPVFGEDWSGISVEGYTHLRGDYEVEPRLKPWDKVIGIEHEGVARAYPIKLLAEHEVINDTFREPLLVTFCPLCGSSITARRMVDGVETTFGVSGLLYRSDLVMYDARTDSKWSQLVATAIRGPRTGETLEIVPSGLTRWDTWQESHPETRVLRPPPDSKTVRGPVALDYKLDKYATYKASEQVGLGSQEFEDGRLHPKTRVLGVSTESAVRAYPFPSIEREGVVNDSVGELPVVVAAKPGVQAELFAYDRRLSGEVLEFEPAGEGRMRAGGSLWEVSTGRPLDGPYRDQRLTRVGLANTVFWFAWLDFHPETEVYDGGT